MNDINVHRFVSGQRNQEIMDSEVLLEQRNSVATITLNRPRSGNTIDENAMNLLIASLHEVARNQDISILVLRGAGEDFCRGREGLSAGARKPTAQQIRDSLRKITIVNELISSLASITIAVVQGRALGFGAGLAVRADLTVAAENARLGFPEIKASLAPTVVMSYLAQWIPRKKAFEMILTGEDIDAAEAMRLGMINRVVPLSRLEQEVDAWTSLLLKTDPAVLRTCKEFLVDAERLAPKEAATYGIHLLATFLSSR